MGEGPVELASGDVRGPAGAAPAAAEAVEFAGIGSRLLAFALDAALLLLLGQALAAVGEPLFIKLGAWGRPFGLLVACLYLAPLTSRLGWGQTLGKRLAGIVVVDRAGLPLSLPRAAGREALLWTLFFANNAAWPFFFGSFIALAAIGCVLGLLASGIAYFGLFNWRTRQSLHDLVFGSYVVRKTSAGRPVGGVTVWSGHYFILAVVLLLLGAVASTATKLLLLDPGMRSVFTAYERLNARPGWIVPTVNRMTVWGAGPGGGAVRTVNVMVVLGEKPESYEKEAQRAAAILLDTLTPEAQAVDRIVIATRTGWDIGLASRQLTLEWVHSPAEWRTIIDSSKAPAAAALVVAPGAFGPVPAASSGPAPAQR